MTLVAKEADGDQLSRSIVAGNRHARRGSNFRLVVVDQIRSFR